MTALVRPSSSAECHAGSCSSSQNDGGSCPPIASCSCRGSETLTSSHPEAVMRETGLRRFAQGGGNRFGDLGDLLLVDDERRRQRDGVAGHAREHAFLQAFQEHGI